MAKGSKRQRKKNAKKMGVYEGGQYRGGRQSGRKNLKRVDGGFQNQHGVVFTQEQKKALERAVNKSNYQRKKMQAEADALNPNNAQLRLMGKESDFILTRQSKSMQRFKSMEDYEKFMDKQARIASGDYLDDMTRLYKRNYMKAVENELEDKGIVMRIRMMKPEDFRKLVEEKGEDMEIAYVYDPSAKLARRNRIRELLGMKLVDDEDPYYNTEDSY